MITSMRLVDGATQMVLYPRSGLVMKGLDPGSPNVREITEVRTGSDGDDDTSSLVGARGVSLDWLATQTPGAFEDEIAAFLHPSKRPYLHVADDEWDQERRLLLRFAQFTPARTTDLPAYMRRVQYQWKAPDGVWEDATGDTPVTILADIPDGFGLAWPATWPISYAATAAAGSQVVTNVGSFPSYFVARLYGPCVGPSLVNVSTGEEITFTNDLVLGAGDYVEVDTRNHTAYAEGLADASRLNYLDFSVSSWWRLQPGAQELRFAPTSESAGAQVVIIYRPVWI